MTMVYFAIPIISYSESLYLARAAAIEGDTWVLKITIK